MTNCEECTLNGEAVEMYVPKEDALPILFIGQAPGETEVLTGVPFTGKAGKMLFMICDNADVDKKRIAQTNLVMCKPPRKKGGGDEVPTSLEMKCCHQRLREEIWSTAPELIVAFGTPVAEHLTGKSPISSYHGTFQKLNPEYEYDCDVLCCYHPAYIARNRQSFPIAVKDMKLVNSYLNDKEVTVKSGDEPEYIFDPSPEELTNYLYSSKDNIIDFDTETTGLNKRHDRIIGCSFSNSSDSAVALYFTDRDRRVPIVKDFLSDEKVFKSMQNGQYDTEMVWSSLGIELKGWKYDTKLAEHLLNSELPGNLNHLRAMYTNMREYKPTKDEIANISTWGKERMLLYACKDALCTRLVRKAQSALMNERYFKIMEEALIPGALILNKMERRGMLVDQNTLAIMYANVIPEIESIMQSVSEKLGINPNSPAQIKKLLKTSNADRDTIERMITRGTKYEKELTDILRMRDLSKGASTFLKGVYDRLEDGRCHTEYNVTGARTGRMSSKNPNLQNIQKKYRVIFIADPGCYIIATDYKQLELQVASILAPCEILRQVLLSGGDVHEEIREMINDYIPARLLWNARNVSKSIVFGTIYGRSPRSIAIAFGVPIATAKMWQDSCFTRYPGLVKYWADRKEDFNKRGYVETPFGRRRYIQSFPQAVNTPVQSTANEIKLRALINLDKAGLDVRLDVHDEIIIMSNKRRWKKDVALQQKIMSAPIPELGGASFPVNTKYGENWYEMEKLNEEKGGDINE